MTIYPYYGYRQTFLKFDQNIYKCPECGKEFNEDEQ